MPYSSRLRLCDQLVFRFAFLALIIGTAAALVLTILFAAMQIHSAKETTARKVEEILQQQRRHAAYAAYAGDPDQASVIVDTLVNCPFITDATLTGKDGGLLAKSLSAAPSLPNFLARFAPAETSHPVSLSTDDDSDAGTLTVTVQYAAATLEAFRNAVDVFMLGVLGSVLVAFILSTVLNRTIFRKIRSAASLLEDPPLYDGEEVIRNLRGFQSRNELGRMFQSLGSAFRTYTEELRHRKSLEQELQDLNRELEERITRRTASLTEQTEALRTEVDVRRAAEESLAEQHAFLNTLFEEIKAGILIFDPASGKMIDSNSVIEKLLGVDRDTIHDLSCTDDRFIFRSDGGEKALLCPDVFNDTQFEEGVLILSEEKTVPLSRFQFRMFLDGHEHLVQVVFDITEQKKLERQLSIAQRLESIGLLAAGISHEINTPIQYIGDSIVFLRDAFTDIDSALESYGGLLEQAESGPLEKVHIEQVKKDIEEADLTFIREEFPKACDMAMDGVQRVSQIVLAMKNFSHAGTDDLKAMDLNKALETSVAVAKNEWKYVSDVVMDLDPGLPLAFCLQGEINQVFLNILVNAAHAIKDVVTGRDTKGTITITSRNEGDYAFISVKDTGCGMTPNVKEKIFDPFFTTKEVGKGTGQGLAIVHDVIVNKHHGSITVNTAPGEGTEFIIRIPFMQPGQTSAEYGLEGAGDDNGILE